MQQTAEISPIEFKILPTGDPVEDKFIEDIHNGKVFEEWEELTPGYQAALSRTLEIAAQGEVTVLTWAFMAMETCPDLGAKISLAGAILDEVGHAHQQGMLWERTGIDLQKEAFERPAWKFWSFPIMEWNCSTGLDAIQPGILNATAVLFLIDAVLRK